MIIPSSSFGVIASSRPKIVVPTVTDYGAGDLAFNNISTLGTFTEQFGNLVTCPKSGTLFFEYSCSNFEAHIAKLYKNGTAVTIGFYGTFTYGCEDYLTTNLITVNTNDTLQFSVTCNQKYNDSFICTIRNQNQTGTIIDTLTFTNTT